MSLARYTDEELRAELARRTLVAADHSSHELITKAADEYFYAQHGCLTCDVWLDQPRARPRRLTHEQLAAERAQEVR